MLITGLAFLVFSLLVGIFDVTVIVSAALVGVALIILAVLTGKLSL